MIACKLGTTLKGPVPRDVGLVAPGGSYRVMRPLCLVRVLREFYLDLCPFLLGLGLGPWFRVWVLSGV